MLQHGLNYIPLQTIHKLLGNPSMFHWPRFAARVAYGAGAFVLGDLVTGLAAFSCISSASLWMFSVGWIRLHSEYAAVGRTFGTTGQLELAWLGAFAMLPTLLGVLYLGISALRLPLRLLHTARAA